VVRSFRFPALSLSALSCFCTENKT
jgi:hypothetical protein